MGLAEVAAQTGQALSAELQERAHSIAAEVLRINRCALASMPDEQRSRMEAIVRTVAARLVQEPRARLETPDGGESVPGARIVAFRELFGLDEDTYEVTTQVTEACAASASPSRSGTFR